MTRLVALTAKKVDLKFIDISTNCLLDFRLAMIPERTFPGHRDLVFLRAITTILCSIITAGIVGGDGAVSEVFSKPLLMMLSMYVQCTSSWVVL